ncbi:MAG TPA: hypothetical protein VMI10_10410 [Terriglobales bacterium]|nr:hypothetical protein [Terriglobales bacterium]HTT21691.1 hypothetical protein [Candidatus Sulfotelmatobacter sp.]
MALHEDQVAPEGVLAELPRQLAEQLESPFGPAIAVALRRHAAQRYANALHF